MPKSNGAKLKYLTDTALNTMKLSMIVRPLICPNIKDALSNTSERSITKIMFFSDSTFSALSTE